MAAYDADYVRALYRDADREWGRFEHRGPAGRANLHLHSWHLRQRIRAGDRVLDVGAGPGRFTIELARLGARVTVGDLSPEQLEANRQKVMEAGLETSVEARAVMDVVDLSPLAAESFDAVVCYGGALSYVFDRADAAVGELLRVTRPGGLVLLSVMSLLGSVRHFLEPCLKLARQHGPAVISGLLATHDQVGAVAGESADSPGHRLRYYTWADLRALLGRHRCEVVDASAANFLAVGGNAERLRTVLDGEHQDDAALWEAFLEWEVACCREPGAMDGGTHIIAVARKT